MDIVSKVKPEVLYAFRCELVEGYLTLCSYRKTAGALLSDLTDLFSGL